MALRFFIAGVERTSNVLLDNYSIEQVLTQEVDSCSFRIQDIQPTEGQEVRIEDDLLGRLFGGIIDQVKLVDTRTNNAKFYDVNCQDYTYQLDRKLVIETYEKMTADAIVKDIILKYGSGFTTTNVRTGTPTVEYIVFDYLRPSECLKELANYVGWDWFVGYNKDVWFFNPSELNLSAPISITSNANIRRFQHGIDTQGLRNRVYVRGGTMLSDLFTYEWEADGVARIWSLPHKPDGLTTITVGGLTKSIGIENKDDEATKDYLINIEEKYVRASVQTTTLAKGTKLSLPYKYPIDVITMVEDIASQNAITSIQGGDGVYEHVIVDDSLISIDAAEAAGNADLKEHANPRVKGSFETEITGWNTGQLLSVDLPDRGINNTFLIQRVSISTRDGKKLTFRIDYGGRLLGIADFLKALVSAQQKKKLNETSLLHKFTYGQEKAKMTDELISTPRTPPWKCGDSDAICGFVQCG